MTAAEVRARVLAAIDAAARRTFERRDPSSREVRRGIYAAKAAVEAVPSGVRAREWFERAFAAIEAARAECQDPHDDDGWALGGVGTARRELDAIHDEVRIALSLEPYAEALEAAFPDRAAALLRQIAILFFGPDTLPPSWACVFCGGASGAQALNATTSVCARCARILVDNLEDARAGRTIPEADLVLAETKRALGGERAAALSALESRAAARPTAGRCRLCAGDAGARAWTANLPRLEVCDACIESLAERFGLGKGR